MPKPYSLDLRERVVSYVDEGHSRRAAAAHFRVSVSFAVNLVKAFRVRGSLAPKPSGGRRHAKLEPHRAFLLEKVAEKADITMPELAPELAAATCQKADPASLSRWLIRIGYRFKKTGSGRRPACGGGNGLRYREPEGSGRRVFGGADPVKKLGPWAVADLRVVTPTGDPD